MRIILTTTPNDNVIPFNYQKYLIGVLHKWLGKNEIHDNISLHSFSWLKKGVIQKNGFDFRNGAEWFISFHKEKYVKQIVKSILEKPDMFFGMRVSDIQIDSERDWESGEYCFRVASPILIKRTIDYNNIKFYTYEDAECGELMTDTLKNKMSVAGLPADETLSVEFDMSYYNKKIKLVDIHGIKNKCSMCPIIIKGQPESIEFARNVGIGNSTGSGFGSIY
ncbi:MAG: CRISPR-associated endoribonuclease Cas6 [Dysgonamonadaceae bacterium]|nr:CRISPR-associated endoribonuclease Cas6 [Dysgonamonadaceae bacterium]